MSNTLTKLFISLWLTCFRPSTVSCRNIFHAHARRLRISHFYGKLLLLQKLPVLFIVLSCSYISLFSFVSNPFGHVTCNFLVGSASIPSGTKAFQLFIIVLFSSCFENVCSWAGSYRLSSQKHWPEWPPDVWLIWATNKHIPDLPYFSQCNKQRYDFFMLTTW